MYDFDVKKVTKNCIDWIRDWFNKNGKGCKAVIGISAGKDSSIVAALCVKALGKENVLGVLMPCGLQKDINMAYKLCDNLGISYTICNIEETVNAVYNSITGNLILEENPVTLSNQTKTNLPARIRMATLYAISQSVNGRVANTCNLSEDYVGYATKYGDAAGDFSPLSNLTVSEVKAIGYELGLPKELIEKTPTDGLCGKTDEENLGFTYEILDKYIRTGVCEDEDTKKLIDELHEKNLFKLQPMESFDPKK